jgi:hypothetical protein
MVYVENGRMVHEARRLESVANLMREHHERKQLFFESIKLICVLADARGCCAKQAKPKAKFQAQQRGIRVLSRLRIFGGERSETPFCFSTLFTSNLYGTI